jgi:hypothetical protein
MQLISKRRHLFNILEHPENSPRITSPRTRDLRLRHYYKQVYVLDAQTRRIVEGVSCHEGLTSAQRTDTMLVPEIGDFDKSRVHTELNLLGLVCFFMCARISRQIEDPSFDMHSVKQARNFCTSFSTATHFNLVGTRIDWLCGWLGRRHFTKALGCFQLAAPKIQRQSPLCISLVHTIKLQLRCSSSPA